MKLSPSSKEAANLFVVGQYIKKYLLLLSGLNFPITMAKKPRSQRRKGGKTSDNGGEEASVSKADALSDTHTVDDSVGLSLFEDEYAFGGK